MSSWFHGRVVSWFSAAGFHVAFSKKIMTSVELTGPLKFSKDVGNLHYDVPFICLNENRD